MKCYTFKQRTPEWHLIRRGVPTGSEFSKILTPVKATPSSSQKSYMAQLFAEVQDQRPNSFGENDKPITRAMQDGLDMEPEARRWIAMELNLDVQEYGFISTEDDRFGWSPDGMIGEEEGLELKCPQLATINEWWLDGGGLPDEHKCQLHAPLALAMLDPTIKIKRMRFVAYSHWSRPMNLIVEPNEFTAKLAKELQNFWGRMMEAWSVLGQGDYLSVIRQLRARNRLDESVAA